jgi:hypothetical protein
MKFFYQFLLVSTVILVVISCGKGDIIADRTPLSLQIVGTWIDSLEHTSYTIENGINVDTIIKKECTYHFADDGTFYTEKEIVRGMFGGNWSLNTDENLITFKPTATLVDSLIPSEKTFTWEVNSYDGQILNVNYHYTEDRVLPSGQKPDFKIKRVFVKQ